MNKIGQTGFSIVTIYRVFAVILVSVVILGTSSIIYSHHINVRDSEAMIMVREISECVVSESVVDLDKLRGEKDIFSYCGFNKNEVESFFISLSVLIDTKEVFAIEGGDSGLLWVKDVYNGDAKTKVIDRYEPGHFKWFYNVGVLDAGLEKPGILIVEVVVNAE